MAQVLPYTSIQREDLPGVPDWIDRLLVPLNGNFEALQTALNKGLTVAANLRESIVTVTFTTPTNYWQPWNGTSDGIVSGYVAPLTGATTTINSPAVNAAGGFFFQRESLGVAAGTLTLGTRVQGVSFQILSSSGTDDGGVRWVMLDPAPCSFTVARFQTGLPVGVKAQGIEVLQTLTNTRAQLRTPISIAWSEPTLGTAQLDFVTGLAASTIYQMTLRVV